MADEILIRQVAERDLNCIMAWWLRDLRDADPGALPDDLWFPAHREMIERLLADPQVQALVAVDPLSPPNAEILGFVVAEPGKALHWCHIRKGPLREQGLAKRLLTEANCPPGTPAAWTTPLARKRLRNPWRGRAIRRAAASSTAPSR